MVGGVEGCWRRSGAKSSGVRVRLVQDVWVYVTQGGRLLVRNNSMLTCETKARASARLEHETHRQTLHRVTSYLGHLPNTHAMEDETSFYTLS